MHQIRHEKIGEQYRRLAVGCLIIKHRLNISNREVIDTLQENIYLQYFVGFRKFKKERAFDPSLFVELKKRMGNKQYDMMNRTIIEITERRREKRGGKTTKSKKGKPPKEGETPSRKGN